MLIIRGRYFCLAYSSQLLSNALTILLCSSELHPTLAGCPPALSCWQELVSSKLHPPAISLSNWNNMRCIITVLPLLKFRQLQTTYFIGSEWTHLKLTPRPSWFQVEANPDFCCVHTRKHFRNDFLKSTPVCSVDAPLEVTDSNP